MSLDPKARHSASDRDDASSSPVPSIAAILLLTLSLLWCIVWFVHSWGYWEDDSFIHLEFARSFAAGHGFAFNGRVVYGDTAPLWVFFLAGMHRLIPNWLVAGKVLAILGVFFSAAGVYTFSRRLTAKHAGSTLFAAMMVLLFVLNPYFCYWSFSGMETLTAAGLALWGVVAATSTPFSWPKFLLGCALAGIAPLLRPELVFYTAILGLVLLYRRYVHPEVLSITRKLAGFAAGLALLSGPTIAWAIYAVHTFGRVVPNTNAAKRAGPGSSVSMRLVNVYSLGYPVILFGLLAALLYLALHASDLRERLQAIRRSRVFTSGGWIFVLWTILALVFYIVNHTYVQTRYILVSAVGLSIVTLAGLLAASQRLYRICLIGSLAAAAFISIFSAWPFIRNKGIFVEEARQQALFIRNELPADAPVADYSIGEIAYYSEHPIIDTGGITRPGAIPYLNAPASEMIRWMRSEGAVYYVTTEKPEPGAVLVHSQTIPFFGWSLSPRRYAQTDLFNIWMLAPEQPVAPASGRP
jgi:hypothetical protein